MAQEIITYIKCRVCDGHHNYVVPGQNGQSSSCLYCNEDGYIEFSKITFDPGHDDILNKCNDILDKCNDILETVS